jgi:hypothetical protein
METKKSARIVYKKLSYNLIIYECFILIFNATLTDPSPLALLIHYFDTICLCTAEIYSTYLVACWNLQL